MDPGNNFRGTMEVNECPGSQAPEFEIEVVPLSPAAPRLWAFRHHIRNHRPCLCTSHKLVGGRRISKASVSGGAPEEVSFTDNFRASEMWGSVLQTRVRCDSLEPHTCKVYTPFPCVRAGFEAVEHTPVDFRAWRYRVLRVSTVFFFSGRIERQLIQLPTAVSRSIIYPQSSSRNLSKTSMRWSLCLKSKIWIMSSRLSLSSKTT